MFGGIVEEIGSIQSLERSGPSAVLEVAARLVLEGTRVGDSIAVNGACLTVTALQPGSFLVDLAPETLRRTNLGNLRLGSPVNLERGLAVGARLGGHFVQGHVDGVGRVRSLTPEAKAIMARISAPPEVMRYAVPKGFMTVDGASLTVVERFADNFTLSLIPYTLAHTIAGRYRIGDEVNLEVDILGKYVERFLVGQGWGAGLSREFLTRHGFTG